MQSESPTAVPSQRRYPVGPFTVFRQANFRWFFLSTILANCATWTQDVTLSWLVYDLTASGAMLGTMSLVRTIATLGLSPMAGIAIDQRSRRSLMFDTPLRQTVLFVLVPRRLTPSALGINQTGWAVMRTLGPAIGAFLLVRMGAGGSFLIQAVIYAIIMMIIVQLRFPRQHSAEPGTAVSSSFAEGLRHIVKNANIRAFAFMGCILRLFIIPVFTVMPAIFAKDLFQGGPQVLGWLLSAVGLGGVWGGFVATSLVKTDRRGQLELGAMLLLGLSLVGFAFSTQLWVALVFLGLAGLFEMVFLITNQTLLQLSIPDGLRGRVNGIITLSSGLLPLGSLIAGIGADTIGPRPTTALLGGFAAAITAIVFLASPTIRRYRLSRVLASERTS
jgi:predicted MFS family arabinose efflux permease